MLTLPTLLTFALATAIAGLVPGPTVAIIVASSMRHGTRAGMLTALGAETAVLSMLAVVAVGLEAVMAFMGWAFEWIKLVGAAYLIYIGWRMFTAKKDAAGNGQDLRSKRSNFILQGFFVVWSNPKTLLFLGAFLPHFIVADAPTLPQLVVLGTITMILAVINDFGYALAAGGLRRLMNEARSRLVSRLSGLVLMAGGVWLAMQKRT
jgi:threonine/homoserine/homoserine lactone efflux protein